MARRVRLLLIIIANVYLIPCVTLQPAHQLYEVYIVFSTEKDEETEVGGTEADAPVFVQAHIDGKHWR